MSVFFLRTASSVCFLLSRLNSIFYFLGVSIFFVFPYSPQLSLCHHLLLPPLQLCCVYISKFNPLILSAIVHPIHLINRSLSLSYLPNLIIFMLSCHYFQPYFQDRLRYIRFHLKIHSFIS